MTTIYKIIESVASIGSTKTKQEILEKNKDNTVLRNCFYYSENPRFNYFIKMVETAVDQYHPVGTRDIDITTFAALDKIINREYTGDAAKEFLATIMIPLSVEARIIVSRIVNKDLRCGASTAIANKVWDNLIPEYPVMLAGKFDEKAKKYLSQFENTCGFIVQKKADGGRIITKVDKNGNVSHHSRNGSALELFGVFDSQFVDLSNCVFDGELVVLNKGQRDRKLGNGLYTKAVRNTLTPQEAKKFTMEIWDIIPLSEYMSGIGEEGYSDRLQQLNILAKQQFKKTIKVIAGKTVKTLEECLEYYNEMREAGEEGAIIKVANSVWEDARSKNSVKLKAVNDIDAICIGWEPGSGKYANMIGNLICETGDGLVRFNVGTGLKDDDRKKDPSEYLGKIIECTYNEVISAKDREVKSLFLPVFKQIRIDKLRANTLAELK